MSKQFTLVRVLILFGYIGFPIISLTFFYFSKRELIQCFFVSFIMLHAIERVWETFTTTKERKVDQLHGDWTLIAVTIAYIFLCFSLVFEFFLSQKGINFITSLLGFVFYIIAFRIRWWGMKSLGKQWAIHAVGAQKIKKVRIIKIGAYKYMRHPIYVGSMLEMISLPLIICGPFTAIFAATINIPLQIIRTFLEEKNALRRFGNDYRNYQKTVDMFIPIKYFKNKVLEYVRR